MSKARIQITEQEAAVIFKAISEGNKFVIIRGNYVTLPNVDIYKDEVFDDKAIGRLHDGTRVIKRFGAWTDADDPKLILDPTYYPEIASDKVMTEREYANRDKAKLLQTGQQGGTPQLTDGSV